ncbi:C-terminal binding protein [Virgibacillus senegalensis]|uniref:C-terminal binding protein n=1 Tax=Virgibacillus senegalensis TaxID=1499679 RepID=UPI00069D69F0|nr:C-terminal binding protein [Virgibacillus senegalensis]
MGKFKVVITDYEYNSLAEEKNIFEKLDVELVGAQCRTEEEVIAAARDADGILNQYAPITANIIRSLRHCKVISRYGIGVDTVDLNAATNAGIVVANVTDYCLEEVSDHALALLLNGARNIAAYNKQIKQGRWDYKKGSKLFRLQNRVLGLVGFGHIAQLLARKAQGLGMKVVAADPFVSEQNAASLDVELVSLKQLCRQSDFISVHTPLNEKTRGLIGRQEFDWMKEQAYIVNTSRGPVINEAELIEALQQEKIAGAGLDVLEKEPLEDHHPFLSMEQVTLTPHAAWYSEDSEADLKRKSAQNVADVLLGYFPEYLVNTEVKEKIFLSVKG